jgi:hypothetical protein
LLERLLHCRHSAGHDKCVMQKSTTHAGKINMHVREKRFEGKVYVILKRLSVRGRSSAIDQGKRGGAVAKWQARLFALRHGLQTPKSALSLSLSPPLLLPPPPLTAPPLHIHWLGNTS